MTKLKILSIGEVIYSWKVLELLPNRYYRCQCKCGNTSKIRAHDLINGKSKTCRSCQISIAKKGHSQTNTPEYTSWSHIVQRIFNPKDKDWPEYGGRGITMEPSWADSFEAFLMAIGPCPGPGYTVDRIDGTKGYEYGNVRWADKETQNRNRSCNINITYNGETKVLSQWIEELSITNGNTFYKRISESRRPENADYNQMFTDFVNNTAKFKND